MLQSLRISRPNSGPNSGPDSGPGSHPETTGFRSDLLVLHLASLFLCADFVTGSLALWLLGKPATTSHDGVALAELKAGMWIALRVAVVIGCAWFASRALGKEWSVFFDLIRDRTRTPSFSGLRQRHEPSLVDSKKFFADLDAVLEQQFNDRALALASISHDLNSHLARLSLRVQSLADTKTVSSLVHDMTQMAQMLEATLTYLTDTQTEEPFASVGLVTLVDELIEDVVLAGGRAHRTGTVDTVYGQPLAIRRCIANLVTNAIKYGGGAELVLRETDTWTTIQVADRGPGIPDAELERVLRPFYRLEAETLRNVPGSGVGLSVAREVALRHGGSLHLKNRASGGLVATVAFPRIKAPHHRNAEPATTDEYDHSIANARYV